MTGFEHQTWEYRVTTDPTDEELETLGRNGWELVAVSGGSCYFKRPRLSFREQVTLEQKQRYYALWNVRPGEAETGK